MKVTLKREKKVLWEYKDVASVVLDGYRLSITTSAFGVVKVINAHDVNKYGWEIEINKEAL